MDINISIRNLDIVMPKDLTVRRWDWVIKDLYCNNCCTIIIYLYCDNDVYDENQKNGFMLKSIEYKLEGEEYQNWGQDDTYITNICLRELEKLKTST